MRIIEIRLYYFEELNDSAKENAREWWRRGEYRDPAWLGEHVESLQLGLEAVHDGMDLKPFRDCSVTGYCDDYLVAKAVEEFQGPWDLDEVKRAIEEEFRVAWENEWEYRMQDEAVEECIVMNEYEFTADGAIA